jgi:DTW domain-containing protein YfiP
MSEPRVDDDVALGLDEVCEGCDVLVRYCLCSSYDTLEEMDGDK